MSKEKQKTGLVSDIWHVIKKEKKWWILPLIIILFLITGFTILAGSAGPLAPFLYPLF